MNSKKKLFLLLFLFIAPQYGFSQIQLNSSVDFEISAGGEDSRFITNQISSKYKQANLAVTQLNVFAFAPITDQLFFESRIQLDTWGNGDLNPPRISLASLIWDNPENDYVIRFGRFISPFGFYPKRQLSTDRVFVNHPLGYSYFTNISDIRGFWPQAGNNTNAEYQVGDVGLPSLYFAGYVTGIGTSWDLVSNKVSLDVAITNGTPITIKDRASLSNLAVTSRLQYNQSIFWSQGVSASFGNFLQADAINETVRENNNFQKYTQLLLGTDTKIEFTYFQIIAEVIYSRWKTPAFIGNSFHVDQNKLVEYDLSNFSGNIDFKYELPSLTGSFIALRAEHLLFLEADDPGTTNTLQWDQDVSRITGVFGYKLDRNILAKLSFSEQGEFDGSEYALRFQISAFF
ncbi:MAG: hypothetical protein ABJR05_17490 [Balneola sp.]